MLEDVFTSKSFRAAMKTFRKLHPGCLCFMPKELTSDYRKRRVAEKAGQKVVALVLYGTAHGDEDEAESYALYLVDHATGTVDEVAFGLNDYATLCQRVQSLAAQGTLPPEVELFDPSQEDAAR